MNLQEILTTVDTMVPNNLSVGIKIQWLNHVQNHLFRDYPIPDTVFTFNTEIDQQIYTLPDDCPEDRITGLVIDGDTYPFVPPGVDYEMDGYVRYNQFFTLVSGLLMIFPNPIQNGQAFIYYKPRPVQMKETALTAIPTFPKDYHELLVLGCASRIAKAMGPEQVKLAMVFDTDFRELAAKADRDLKKIRPKRTLVVRSWA